MRMTRRAMLGALACAGLLAGRASARATGPHPDPRPGIDASHLPPPDRVAHHPDAVPAYDEARAIPEVLDGIRCQCGCDDQPGHRSLQGRTLDQIRSAIDSRYWG
jgi:hypothetical protein